jgi:hypothetical protein
MLEKWTIDVFVMLGKHGIESLCLPDSLQQKHVLFITWIWLMWLHGQIYWSTWPNASILINCKSGNVCYD